MGESIMQQSYVRMVLPIEGELSERLRGSSLSPSTGEMGKAQRGSSFLPNLHSLLRSYVHWIILGDAECLVPHIDEREGTVHAPLAE